MSKSKIKAVETEVQVYLGSVQQWFTVATCPSVLWAGRVCDALRVSYPALSYRVGNEHADAGEFVLRDIETGNYIGRLDTDEDAEYGAVDCLDAAFVFDDRSDAELVARDYGYCVERLDDAEGVR